MDNNGSSITNNLNKAKLSILTKYKIVLHYNDIFIGSVAVPFCPAHVVIQLLSGLFVIIFVMITMKKVNPLNGLAADKQRVAQ